MHDIAIAPLHIRIVGWAAGVIGIGAIGVIDYFSGTELRVYPLYFVPIGLLAWHFDRWGAVSGAILGAGTWLYSNLLAGMHFATVSMWVANTVVHGTSFLFVGMLIATLRRTVAGARQLSRTDPLTLLRNSRAFYEDTAPLLALCRRSGRPVTVAYLDLDNFKTINDQHGHRAGDALLRRVADAIRGAVRPSDLCARLGGDEFAIILPELDEREAATTLERVRLIVNSTIGSNDKTTASIGAATFTAVPDNVEDLVHHADALMYTAKAAGRNRVVLKVIDASEGN